MMKTYLGEYYENPERMRSLQQELLITEVTQKMWQAMREKKINRAQLAAKLGITKGRISQILTGRANLTLRTTADIFTALNERLTTHRRELFILEPQSNCGITHVAAEWNNQQTPLWQQVSAAVARTAADAPISQIPTGVCDCAA
jgi:transcriptional regulator with XRE-family HTH domain